MGTQSSGLAKSDAREAADQHGGRLGGTTRGWTYVSAFHAEIPGRGGAATAREPTDPNLLPSRPTAYRTAMVFRVGSPVISNRPVHEPSRCCEHGCMSSDVTALAIAALGVIGTILSPVVAQILSLFARQAEFDRDRRVRHETRLEPPHQLVYPEPADPVVTGHLALGPPLQLHRRDLQLGQRDDPPPHEVSTMSRDSRHLCRGIRHCPPDQRFRSSKALYPVRVKGLRRA